MQIEFSRHVLDQIEIRTRISKAMVDEAIDSPEDILDSFKNRRLYRKTFETDTLEVVAVEEDNKLIIITAYMLEQEP